MAAILATLFLVAGAQAHKALWSSIPATFGIQSQNDYILKTTFPVGNGRLGAMHFGEPGSEKMSLNVDSLWSGGPFENSSYTGGNPTSDKSAALPGIRQAIFRDGTGNVDALLGPNDNYGSYQVLGNLSVSIAHGTSYKNYKRTLNLHDGAHSTSYTVGKAEYTTSLFCSYPAGVCVYHVESTADLPTITVKLENILADAGLVRSTCSSSRGQVRLRGSTHQAPPDGMIFDAVAKVVTNAQAKKAAFRCASDGETLQVTPAKGQKSTTIVLAAGTNFDQSRGNTESKYSFKGEDPAQSVQKTAAAAAERHYDDLMSEYLADYGALFGAFELDLPDPRRSAGKETAALLTSYTKDGDAAGDPFVESLLFDYSRYLLIASSRDNSLPANLYGRWAESMYAAWSADYHANINLQMNYWAASQTGLEKTQDGLWKYMTENWVPRGTETAKLLYGAAKGWVVHDEMNIFGHTAMKSAAEWANYPASAAWMMQHVWDNFDYTQDVGWLRATGYPLLKGVAEFWLSQLQEDDFSKDGTLVVNPCNSPEQGPTTFGCAHYQQLIHQVLETTLRSAAVVNEPDTAFVRSVSASLAKLDKGLHYTDWGGIKEWKIPDKYGYDTKNTHRHLSHLVGWYPGFSIAGFLNGTNDPRIQAAVRETLIARGNGSGTDANAGWEKVWRAACWARLQDAGKAYSELRFAIDENFAANGLSMYSGQNAPFQIDANFGLAGAMLSMLVVDLPQTPDQKKRGVRVVVLGNAIPETWANGSVKGLRVRGNIVVDFKWDCCKVFDVVVKQQSASRGGRVREKVKFVNVLGEALN